MTKNTSNFLLEICAHCGCTRGSHKASSGYSDYYKQYFPVNYCPGNEGRMDWNKGPGTTFNPSGKFYNPDTGEED